MVMMLKLHTLSAKLPLISGNKINFLSTALCMIIISVRKCKYYCLALYNFLNHLEVDRVKKLCVAAETDEKLFWKLLKDQRSSSQISTFLVNGAFITEENDIRDMWADHFEALGTPTVSLNFFDNEFANSISTHIRNIFQNCINDPMGALNKPLTYEEVASICSNLKPGLSSVALDYKHLG